jgi:ribosomal protein S17
MPRGDHLRTLKRIVGVVTSTGMDRTVGHPPISFQRTYIGKFCSSELQAVVMVPRLQIHGLTRKILKTYTKCFAHDHHEVKRCGY